MFDINSDKSLSKVGFSPELSPSELFPPELLVVPSPSIDKSSFILNVYPSKVTFLGLPESAIVIFLFVY